MPERWSGRPFAGRAAFLITALLAAAATATSAAQGYARWAHALPGYRYSFPRDFGAHEAYRNEWWYYTGNLSDPQGRKFGFELTIFRYGVQHALRGGSAWDIDDVFFGHFAVTDVDGHRFYYFDRTDRGALGFASASTSDEDEWVDGWTIRRSGDVRTLHAGAGDVALDLRLRARKKPAINGRNGVSRKGPCATCSSHYYSVTRLDADGSIRIGGATYRATGTAWNDHEWASDDLQAGITGWDWFSMQLDDGTDVMLYRLRHADGSTVAQSSGTVVDAIGSTTFLDAAHFSVKPTGSWLSPHSGARYPSGWIVTLPGIGARLSITPLVADQELLTRHSTGVAYWEGACAISGVARNRAVHGAGYVELTGYAEP